MLSLRFWHTTTHNTNCSSLDQYICHDDYYEEEHGDDDDDAASSRAGGGHHHAVRDDVRRVSADEPQCGRQANGKLCPNYLCCSHDGFCGNDTAWCGNGCQSQCNGCDLASVVSEIQFEEMLKRHDNHLCPGKSFYTYDALVAAAERFPGFATTPGRDGDADAMKREVAAFLAQTSHETMVGWEGPDGSLTWEGYCLKEQAVEPTGDCCAPSTEWPCVDGKQYYGRGPFNISWNTNYGPAGAAVHRNLLEDPELVTRDAVVSFGTALWYWMTPQSSAGKPSCHDVMTGGWSPTEEDVEAGRQPGYGLVTNIINGELECGRGGPDDRVESRIAFYKRYCDILGVDYGHFLDCYDQEPFTAAPPPTAASKKKLIRKVVDA